MATGIKVKIDGQAAFQEKMMKLALSSVKATNNKLKRITLGIHREVIKSITLVSAGRPDKRYNGLRKGRSVLVSKPGDAPNTDQGGLVESYGFNIDINKMVAEVGSDLEYARGLEFGVRSINLAPRPHLRPAFKKVVGGSTGDFPQVKIVGGKDPEFKA